MKRALALIAAVLVVAAVVAPSSAIASRADAPLLTPIGDNAISDLRECLSTNDSLDVYYLLDASGSLFKGSDEHTDPDFVRADLIANSLKELGGLKENLKLNYGLGFFGTNFEQSINWTPYAPREVSRIRSTIRTQESLGWTNWEAGISGAQAQLSKRPSDGCQMLVWLTDGGINVSGNNDAADDAALNNLCGNKIRPGPAPQNGLGAFNEMRQTGIVVVGVLLRVGAGSERDRKYMPYMQPLVEGEGVVRNAKVTCGTHPIPPDYASGAYLHAESPDDLALVFLQLGAAVGGGYPAPFDQDGNFTIDQGVSHFSIVTGTSKWSILKPDGSTLTRTNIGQAGFVIENSGGASKITSPTLMRADVGKWTWTSDRPGRDDLYLYSGLRVQLDDPGTLLAGKQKSLSGAVLRTDGRDTPLDAYSLDARNLELRSSTGTTPVATESIVLDKATGKFTFDYLAEEATGIVVLQATLDDLTTVPTGSKLAPVSASIQVDVKVPDEFPTVQPQPLHLSQLDGADDVASKTWTISPPADGTSGQLCFPEGMNPTILSDGTDRESTWKWRSAPSVKDGACIDVAAGSPAAVTIKVSNSIAANSEVKAAVAVTYRAADGKSIDGSLPITFTSTRPVDAAAFTSIAILLLILGLLLPLVLLWLVNFLVLRKVQRGRQLMRASERVRLSPDGQLTTPDGRDLNDVDWGTEQFRFQSNESDSASVDDPDLGALKARIPVNPFSAPWFEIRPRNGQLVFGPVGNIPPSRRQEQLRGRVLGFSGDLGRVWALVVPEGAVREGGGNPVDGRLVAYSRVAGDPSILVTLMRDISIKQQFAKQIATARESLASDAADSKDGALPQSSAPSRRPAVDDTHPRRSGLSDDPPPPPVAFGADVPAPPRTGASADPPPSRYSSPPEPGGQPRAGGSDDDPPPRKSYS